MTIRHCLQKFCHAAKKPMLTAAIKKVQRLQEVSHWTAAEWRKVMYSDESTFTLVRGV